MCVWFSLVTWKESKQEKGTHIYAYSPWLLARRASKRRAYTYAYILSLAMTKERGTKCSYQPKELF